MVTAWLHDLRYALRALRRSPFFTLIATLTLAICVGADTAVYTVVDGVLLKPLRYPKSNELVAIWHRAPGAHLGANGRLMASASMYFTYAEHNRVFQHIGIWTSASESVTGLNQPEQVPAVRLSDGLLPALGIAPLLGRSFAAADFKFKATPTALLSYGYWQKRFGGEQSAIGRKLTINGVPTEIIGVMPRGFRVADAHTELFIPLQFDRSRLTLPTFDYFGIARLKPGVTVAEANADVARMLPIWMSSWPPSPASVDPHFFANVWHVRPALLSLKQDVIGNIGNVLWLVMGTIATVLLIACANLTNLLLLRAQGRERELAVRAALGGGAWRIARGFLLESLLIALGGGLLGIAFAFAALGPLVDLAPHGLPRLDNIAVDGRALAFTLGVSLVAGLALGLIPALKYAAPRLATALRSGGRAASQGRESRRTQIVLVVAQVALALVLLVSSGLMIRTFQSLRAVQPGFTHASELQTFRLSIPKQLVSEPERVMRMEKGIVDALAAIPSVKAAAFASSMPMDGFNSYNVMDVKSRPRDPKAPVPLRRFKFVSPGLLATVGTRLVAGRDFTWAEVYDARPVAMISASFARLLWGKPAAALGKRIRDVGDRWHGIVGVVQDVRDDGLAQPAPPTAYWPPFKGHSGGGFYGPVLRRVTFVVRSPLAGTAALTEQLQRAVWSVNASLPLANPRTMHDVYADSLARTTFTLMMLATAGGVALVLGVIGLYGVLSYAVSLRRREIAIRLALGAEDRHVRRAFMGYGVTLALVGVALGTAAAAAVTQLMASLLTGVTPLDVPTYAAAATLLIAVAVLASYVPARRASAVDPAQELAAE